MTPETFLLKIKIVQHKTVIDPFKRKRIRKRLNPLNPLTYLFIFLMLIIGIFMFGFIGIWKEINWNDLKFKYR